MLIRFTCPACKGTHSFDMPETTIHMTCGRTGKVVRIHLTAGGDPKPSLVERNGEATHTEKNE